jgi:hypothetical protein
MIYIYFKFTLTREILKKKTTIKKIYAKISILHISISIFGNACGYDGFV